MEVPALGCGKTVTLPQDNKSIYQKNGTSFNRPRTKFCLKKKILKSCYTFNNNKRCEILGNRHTHREVNRKKELTSVKMKRNIAVISEHLCPLNY